jgi:hypothetical protein
MDPATPLRFAQDDKFVVLACPDIAGESPSSACLSQKIRAICVICGLLFFVLRSSFFFLRVLAASCESFLRLLFSVFCFLSSCPGVFGRVFLQAFRFFKNSADNYAGEM